MSKVSSIGIVAAALVLTATVAWSQNDRPAAVEVVRAIDVPASQVFDVDGTPVRLDTRTGALFSLRGDDSARGTAARWWLNVPALSEQTSGMLQVQRTQTNGIDGIFLVDVQEGTTWLLRWRGNQRGSWFRVPDSR